MWMCRVAALGANEDIRRLLFPPRQNWQLLGSSWPCLLCGGPADRGRLVPPLVFIPGPAWMSLSLRHFGQQHKRLESPRSPGPRLPSATVTNPISCHILWQQAQTDGVMRKKWGGRRAEPWERAGGWQRGAEPIRSCRDLTALTGLQRRAAP